MADRNELLDKLPWVQWRPEGDLTDNQDEVETFLEEFETRCMRMGDNLLLQAWGGLNTELKPGDCLVLDGQRLGIVRAQVEAEDQSIIMPASSANH